MNHECPDSDLEELYRFPTRREPSIFEPSSRLDLTSNGGTNDGQQFVRTVAVRVKRKLLAADELIV